jgi:outer membrane receptor protein involved in Fe transport
MQRHEITSDDVLTPGAFATAQWDGWQGRLRGVSGADVAADRVASTKEERRGDKTPAWTWLPAARGNFSDGSRFTTAGAFTHLDADLWRQGDQRLIVTGGGRLSRVSAQAAAVPGVGDVAYDYLGLIGSAGVRWQAGATWQAYANFSQGFRAPNLQETTVLGNTGSKFEVPNAGLRPEASDSYEVGARIDHRGFNLHAAAFVSLLRDAIDERVVTRSEFAAFGIEAADVGCKDLADPACKPLPVIQRVNTEKGTLYGGELTVQGPALLAIRPWLNASLIHGELQNAAGTVTPARRIPPPLGAAGLRYEHPGRRWSAEVYSKFSLAQTRLHPSDEDDLRICENPAKPGTTDKAAGLSCPGTPGWATANVRGGYSWDVVRLDVALTNLLDVRYRYHGSGVDAPGFGGTATLSAEY